MVRLEPVNVLPSGYLISFLMILYILFCLWGGLICLFYPHHFALFQIQWSEASSGYISVTEIKTFRLPNSKGSGAMCSVCVCVCVWKKTFRRNICAPYWPFEEQLRAFYCPC